MREEWGAGETAGMFSFVSHSFRTKDQTCPWENSLGKAQLGGELHSLLGCRMETQPSTFNQLFFGHFNIHFNFMQDFYTERKWKNFKSLQFNDYVLNACHVWGSMQSSLHTRLHVTFPATSWGWHFPGWGARVRAASEPARWHSSAGRNPDSKPGLSDSKVSVFNSVFLLLPTIF